jgi:hypothetical protein
MALLKQHIFSGVVVNNAYHKIEYISGNKDGLIIDVSVSKDAYENANGSIICKFSFVMASNTLSHDDDSSDKNYTKQAYVFMKYNAFTDLNGNQQDYTTATDV